MSLYQKIGGFILISLFFKSFAMAEVDCEVLNDSCQYYLCKEMQTPCGDRGYNIDFGYRYCLKYQDDSLYSEQGKEWLYSVRGCLQHKLNELASDTMCVDLKKHAINSHYQCYIDAGYCQLPLADKGRVLKTAARAMLNFDILLSGFKVLRTCAQGPKIDIDIEIDMIDIL